MKALCFWVACVCAFFAAATVLEAATFYKYIDHNQTVVLTDRLHEVPFEFRKDVQEIVLPDVPREKKQVPPLQVPPDIDELPPRIENKERNENQLRAGKVRLASFIMDRKFLMLGYCAGAIALWAVLLFFLKKFVGGLAAKIVMNLLFTAVLFSGAYLIYLSWLNKTILPSGQVGVKNEEGMDRLTTPKDLADHTQKIVEQLNRNTRAKEDALNEIGE